MEWVRADSYQELSVQAVERITALAKSSVKERGRFTVALAGGDTPQGIYKLLAGPDYQDQVDWNATDLFLGDERWVPKDHPRSNYKMIAEILGPLARRLHPVPEAADPQTSAVLYEQELRRSFGLKPGQLPVFDCVLLGIGQDGHTASLFPGTPALAEQQHLTLAVEAPGVPEPRISLTLPVINNARTVLFAVSGSSKAKILQKIWSECHSRERGNLPAQMVQPVCGELWWLVDKDAGRLLPEEEKI